MFELFVSLFTAAEISLNISLHRRISLQAGMAEQFKAEQLETTHIEAMTHDAINSLPQKHFSIPWGHPEFADYLIHAAPNSWHCLSKPQNQELKRLSSDAFVFFEQINFFPVSVFFFFSPPDQRNVNLNLKSQQRGIC